jgi:hypothetical protein
MVSRDGSTYAQDLRTGLGYRVVFVHVHCKKLAKARDCKTRLKIFLPGTPQIQLGPAKIRSTGVLNNKSNYSQFY